MELSSEGAPRSQRKAVGQICHICSRGTRKHQVVALQGFNPRPWDAQEGSLSSSPYFVDVPLISHLGSVLANPKLRAAPLRAEPTVSAGGIGVVAVPRLA